MTNQGDSSGPASAARAFVQLASKLWWRLRYPTARRYWRKRLSALGARSVINSAHPVDAYDEVTQAQQAILFPLLKGELRGHEQSILDYGCGPGRFSSGLARLIDGQCLAVDLISDFFGLAPAGPGVSYRELDGHRIPADDESMDVVWVSLVLGGITQPKALDRAVSELRRVLKADGLLFVAENTAEHADLPYWHYRSVAFYERLLAFANPTCLASYEDLGESISVLAGRKQV